MISIKTHARAKAILLTLVALIVAPRVTYGQEIYELRHLPRATELEAFKDKIAKRRPVDAGTLFEEIGTIERVRQRLAQIRVQPSQVDSLREQLRGRVTTTLRAISSTKTKCKESQSVEGLNGWWVNEEFPFYKFVVSDAAEYVGVPPDQLTDPMRVPKEGESCEAYAAEIAKVIPVLQKTVMDSLVKYQRVEKEKLNNISALDIAYKAQGEQLGRDLELARQRQQKQEETAQFLGKNLWTIILALGSTAIIILGLVRLFPEKTQLELVQSGQVVQFITVLLLLTVIMALGLSGIIKETTLGTLLGGIGGYVLS